MSKKISVTQLVRRIVKLNADRTKIEKAIRKEYKALGKQIIPECERAIGRPIRYPADLMDWIRKNRKELKALDTTPGDNWEYWPASLMLDPEETSL